MTLFFIDGCEDFSAWALFSGGTIAEGRYNNGFMLGGPAGSSDYRHHCATAEESATFTAGAAWKCTLGLAACPVMAFVSDSTATEHTFLKANANGSLYVLRSATTLATSAAGVVALGNWYYIEMQATLSDTVGQVQVRVNGTSVINTAANLDTKNAGTKTGYDGLKFSYTSGTGYLVDDVYIKNGAGETFLGSITVENLLPNGNGATSQWIGSDIDSTDNYLLVDDVNSGGSSADFVQSLTPGHQDLYTMSDLAHVDGTIIGVQHSALGMRTNSLNARSVQLVNRRASNTNSPSIPLGATQYKTYDYLWENDPETSAPWTIANVNSLQSGVETV